MEGIQYDAKSGQMLTGSFLDYAMPRASDFCSFELIDHPTLTDTNPIGSRVPVRSIAACAMPVVVNAVVNALAGLGIKHIDMPMTGRPYGQRWEEFKIKPLTETGGAYLHLAERYCINDTVLHARP